MSNAELIAKAQQARSPVMEAGAINGGTVKWCTLCHTRWHTDRVEGEQHELTCPWPLVSQLAAALAQADAALAAAHEEGRLAGLAQAIELAERHAALMVSNREMAPAEVRTMGAVRADELRVFAKMLITVQHLGMPLPQPPRTDRET